MAASDIPGVLFILVICVALPVALWVQMPPPKVPSAQPLPERRSFVHWTEMPDTAKVHHLDLRRVEFTVRQLDDGRWGVWDQDGVRWAMLGSSSWHYESSVPWLINAQRKARWLAYDDVQRIRKQEASAKFGRTLGIVVVLPALLLAPHHAGHALLYGVRRARRNG
jgi:hypothetical protein